MIPVTYLQNVTLKEKWDHGWELTVAPNQKNGVLQTLILIVEAIIRKDTPCHDMRLLNWKGVSREKIWNFISK